MEEKEIKVGDYVRIWKPKDVNECPVWLEEEEVYEGDESMDQFDGKTGVVERIDVDGFFYIEGILGFCFHYNWLTLTNNLDLNIMWTEKGK